MISDDWKYRKLKLLERWEAICEKLQIRKQINAHPQIVVVAGIVSVLLILWTLDSILFGEPRTAAYDGRKKVYFYDLNTGELFPASAIKSLTASFFCFS